MTIAANNRHTGLCVAQLGADDVNDTLIDIVQIVQANAKLFAILTESIDLLTSDGVSDRQIAIVGGDVMVRVAIVRSGRRTLRPASRRPSKAWGW